MGVRIEHLQSDINKSMYGTFAKQLPAADYKLAVHLPSGYDLYTFCMCPGGNVVAAASEEGHLVVNGMSNHARDERNANSALLVGISPRVLASEHPLAGMFLQQKLEQQAFWLAVEIMQHLSAVSVISCKIKHLVLSEK